ncbi:DNA-binding MarR family transcriptional regulator [Sphingomonas zeicaulis]|uniref:hypothetical protein n=1 Tax=Sphingomonas zeicaulis TaxID=1632740 RepID=UPI003D215983
MADTVNMRTVGARAERLKWARLIMRGRDLRDEVLSLNRFADPVWDMLLELYVAACEGRDMTVAETCRRARVPGSNALRWVREMERLGQVTRSLDLDAASARIRLTDDQMERLDRFFEGMSLMNDVTARSP